MYKEISQCRICGNANLVSILDLGIQALTGVFPKSKDAVVTSGPLELVKCHGDENDNFCGLVQLKHSYQMEELYGENYGYRSGLNQSMVTHLHAKVKKILNRVSVRPGDLVIDIGSNDGTLLRGYPDNGIILVGIDPTGGKFRQHYPEHIKLMTEFFSEAAVRAAYGGQKAKVITSIAMFYDLEDPVDFMEQVHEVLADGGIWVFEQSYLPTMMEMNAYDTVCHEHLEYYCLKQIKWLTDRTDFKIVDLELNSVNGGSFSVTVAKSNSPYPESTSLINRLLHEEDSRGLGTLQAYGEFNRRVFEHRDELCGFLQKKRSDNERILGYGASTKGNVILQFCRLTEKNIPFIAEVNTDKFGRFTPGTHIPIISEAEARALRPDYFMVLPWHFKASIVERESAYLNSGGKLFFPLPFLETVEKVIGLTARGGA
jgi:hypothetical protein